MSYIKKKSENSAESEELNTDFTREEQKILLKNKIDPKKVYEGMILAKSGNLQNILSLSQLFYELGDIKRVKMLLEIGVKHKYPEAIYNLAVIYKEEKNMKKYEELMGQLPKKYIVESPKVTRLKYSNQSVTDYNKGIDLIKEKKYEDAIEYFEKAYEAGIKGADLRLGYLYKEIGEREKSAEWLKKSSKRGSKEATYQLGLLLFEMGNMGESREYLEKAYKGGNKKLALAIAITYEMEQDGEKALKWYKTAMKNGDKEAEKIVKDLENAQKKKLENMDSIFGNLSSEYSILDSTLDSVLYPKKKVVEDTRAGTKSKERIIGIRGSNAVEKPTYNVGRDELLNVDTYIIK